MRRRCSCVPFPIGSQVKKINITMRQGRKFPKSLERSKSFFLWRNRLLRLFGKYRRQFGLCVHKERERETQPIRTPSVTVVISNKIKLYSPPPSLLFDRISPSGFRLLLILWIFGSVSFYTGLILCVCRQCTNHGPKQLSVGFLPRVFRQQCPNSQSKYGIPFWTQENNQTKRENF